MFRDAPSVIPKPIPPELISAIRPRPIPLPRGILNVSTVVTAGDRLRGEDMSRKSATCVRQVGAGSVEQVGTVGFPVSFEKFGG